MRYTVILSPEYGGYSVFCPAMPGAVSQGDSRDEALAMIADAMEGWLEASKSTGGQPLVETPALIAAKIQAVLGYRLAEELDFVIETAVVSVRVLVPA